MTEKNAPAKVLVEYKGLNIYRAAGLRFVPGNNAVDAEAWARAKELPLVRHRIDTDVLVEKQADAVEGDGQGADLVASLEGLNATKAIAEVEKTIDPALLEGWLAEETRATVKAAIEKRLAAIDPENKDKNDDKDKGGAK
ncbi:hypothetical protein D3C72_718840 [compost metagenome]